MKIKLSVFLLFITCVTATAQIDHSEYLEGPFASPQEITETCLLCHEGIDNDIMKTRHWNWLGNEFTTADGKNIRLGKQNLINNFCIAVPSNWPRCTSCHIGYGWKDDTFNFTDGRNIDCLVCHDQTGTYKKTPTGSGMPDSSVDLVRVAQSVGRTGIQNCSICHFNGGGGTGVKHGDMDESLLNPSPELDIHMGALGFTCSDCHAGENHRIMGASHGSMAAGTNHISCTDCHGSIPHRRKLINDHSTSVACETCHIPAFAREEPTKTWWDWSTAGQNKKVLTDEFGLPLYDKKKGDFKWEKNIVPEYTWYNGKADYYLMGDKIPSGEILELNKPSGNFDDATAKITPFKVMKGRQVYDLKNDYLIVAKLFGKDGYWSTFDWDSASKLGMEAVNLAYSGRFAFIETRMYWPINHMIAPAKDALRCIDCHSRRGDSRMNWEALGYKGDPMSHGGRN